MKRICFLFNHDQVHQIPHSLPIAIALARRGGFEIVLAIVNDRVESAVRDALANEGLDLPIVRLGLRSATSRVLASGLDGIVPARRILLYRDNLDFFRAFDALVVPEKTSLLLKTRYGIENLKIIHTRHGAGDRALSFKGNDAAFDLILVGGEKYRRRLIEDAGVDPERLRIVGYSKFDMCANSMPDLGFADPNKPTVLYNPHPSPKMSSWFKAGERVLETFLNQDRYNFIFAPHIMLFARKWSVTISPPAFHRTHYPDPRYTEAGHMFADLGSPASSDMSYTNAADVYLGDVSSQVYEYILRPRPCLFIDAHGVDWQGDENYKHWRMGPVIGPDADILAAVDRAIATHGDYLPTQQALFDDTFSFTDIPAAVRASQEIARFLEKRD